MRSVLPVRAQIFPNMRLLCFLVLILGVIAQEDGVADAPVDAPADASDPLGGRKPSELIEEHKKNTGRCDDYCGNPCSEFAWGGDTILECNGCKEGDNVKCFPGAPHYGDDWAERKVEL